MAQPAQKSTLTKDERHVLIKTQLQYLIAQPDGELRRLFDANQKDLRELTNKLVTLSWTALREQWPTLTTEVQLVSGGVIRAECLKSLGEIEHAPKHLDREAREKPEIKAKVSLIGQLYKANRVKLGKRPMESSAVVEVPKRARPNEATSHEGHFIPGPPFIFHLERNQIEFHAEQRLGEGSFATALKCKVIDDNFPLDTYVAKLMHSGDKGMTPDALAAMEATRLTVTHRGMVGPLAIHRDEDNPIIIYHYWNGGNLSHWTWEANRDSKQAPPRYYKSISKDIGTLERVQRHLFHIISGLLYTIDFMHSKDTLHNDIHLRNIFLHFSTTSEEVYVGLGDWGKATRINTHATAVRLPDGKPETKTEWQKMYPWMAPECFSLHPPRFCRAMDIYSICYVIKRLLKMIQLEPRDPANRLVSQITRYVNRGLAEDPKDRPPAYDLLNAIAGARNCGVPLDRNSGLRPFNE